MAEDEASVDDELALGSRERAAQHPRELVHWDAVLLASRRERRGVDHKALVVHAPPPGAPRHLPELVGSAPAVAAALVVRLIQLREHHCPRWHVHSDRQRLRRKHYLDEPGLEEELDVLAEDGEHAGVVVRDPPPQQLFELLPGLEFAELLGEAPEVLPLHSRHLRLDSAHTMAPLALLVLPLHQRLPVLFRRLFLGPRPEQRVSVHAQRRIHARLARHAKDDSRELVEVLERLDQLVHLVVEVELLDIAAALAARPLRPHCPRAPLRHVPSRSH
mmetsp:Transcript_5106/g.11975  ORF Transcript_5106/g.11975 Transcript_5106/m.11975 type:complete len:275 (-) Transcript_5106:2731-3555(-)